MRAAAVGVVGHDGDAESEGRVREGVEGARVDDRDGDAVGPLLDRAPHRRHHLPDVAALRPGPLEVDSEERRRVGDPVARGHEERVRGGVVDEDEAPAWMAPQESPCRRSVRGFHTPEGRERKRRAARAAQEPGAVELIDHAGVLRTSVIVPSTASAPRAKNRPASIAWNVQKRSFGW